MTLFHLRAPLVLSILLSSTIGMGQTDSTDPKQPAPTPPATIAPLPVLTIDPFTGKSLNVKTPATPAKKIKRSSAIPEKREFSLNKDLNPCENFHEYVCSNVEDSFELRKDRSSHVFAFSDSSERILEHKKNFLKNIKKEKNLSPRAEQIKASYLACMNVNASKKEEREFVKLIQEEVAKIKKPEDLLKHDFESLTSGRSALMAFSATNSSSNPDIHTSYIGLSFMGLPEHSYYENEALVKDYKQLQVDFFKIIDPKAKAKDLADRVEHMFQFEKKFIEIYPKIEVRRQRWAEQREMSQAEFLKKFPNLQAEKYFALIPPNISVRVPVPESLDFYNSILNAENIITIKDLLLYRKIGSLMDDAYPEFFKKKFEFRRKYFGGAEVRPVRQERCTLDVMDTFEKEFDELMIPRLFPNFPEEKMKLVAAKIRESILQGIENNKWLSRSSKKEAKKKIETARLQLVVPKTDREWDFLPVQVLSENEPIRNQIKLSKAYFDKVMREVPGPTNKDSWGMGPLTVNASYSMSENQFLLPMGILQYPFFVAEGDLIENLGAVGAVVGHELGHAIDDQGSKFDASGKINQWMSMKDLAEFQKRGERMVVQFNKVGHNGKLTLGENVADLVGVSFAYDAAFPKNIGSITDKQKFFISYARVWCGVRRQGDIERRLKTDPHALGWARINEQVKHQKGFQEAFSCKDGDPMTLPDSERIHIW